MAVNVLVPLLIPLGEQLSNVTKLMASDEVEFGQSRYEVQVSEAMRPGPVLQLTARVRHEVPKVAFRITDGNINETFRIDESSGQLVLVKELDYEIKRNYNLTVEAQVGSSTGKTFVSIEVLDFNEFSPKFPRTVYETQITEDDDRHLPKAIILIKASDKDGGQFGTLRYLMRGDGVDDSGAEPCFSINETTGALLLLKPLDRDSPSGRSQWRLVVTASDSEKSASTNVIINVKDVNDNAPYFPEATIRTTISESIPKGSFVLRVTGKDDDDPAESLNARLTYSLEKNAIDEVTGHPIFQVDKETGEISTALCCLDREKTREYAIQVVVTDGGGLKGTATVLIDVSDVNDVPPRWSRKDWMIQVLENVTRDDVLATLTVVDDDTSNEFIFQVMSESGPGWSFFVLEHRPGVAGADLRTVQELDFENQTHRNGFRFQIKVTDRGTSGWSDKYNTDQAWVNIHLEDVNDNSPRFETPDKVNLTLSEDTPVGTSLARFSASDADKRRKISNFSRRFCNFSPHFIKISMRFWNCRMICCSCRCDSVTLRCISVILLCILAGEQIISYSLSPTGGNFHITSEGRILLQSPFDREKEPSHRVLVWAVDEGIPPRTATATLMVQVTDINDNAPFISGGDHVVVLENSKPLVISELTLDDPDDWNLGHGPPFSLRMDPYAPYFISSAIKVTFDSDTNGGRGLGVVSTLKMLDREDLNTFLVPLIVSDSGTPSMTSTVTLTVEVADENDNPMAPASKTVYAHVFQPNRWPVPLGRIYVRDPDDWDFAHKSYKWLLSHSHFSLNATTGHLSMSPEIGAGRYDLSFSVSDTVQKQKNVQANVSVVVQLLTPSDVASATPVLLSVDPHRFISEKKGKSLLDVLLTVIQDWFRDLLSNANGAVQENSGPHIISLESIKESGTLSRIWLSHRFATPISHLLLDRKEELEAILGIKILEVGLKRCKGGNLAKKCKGECWTKAELGRGYDVVDGNVTSFVGPAMTVVEGCGCSKEKLSNFDAYPVRHEPLEEKNRRCHPSSCMNGGSCIPTSGGYKCICPKTTSGTRCKILERHFKSPKAAIKRRKLAHASEVEEDKGNTWAWVDSPPTCPKVHISLNILTKDKEGVLLYAGPLATSLSSVEAAHDRTKRPEYRPRTRKGHPSFSRRRSPAGGSEEDDDSDMLLLQLKEGKPFLVLDLGSGPVTVHLNDSYSLSDFLWHRIDIFWKEEILEVIIDICSGESLEKLRNKKRATQGRNSFASNATLESTEKISNKFSCIMKAKLPSGSRTLNAATPMHLGGVDSRLLRDKYPPRSFSGCIKDLRFNSKIVDLGYRIFGKNSQPGCPHVGCDNEGAKCSGPHQRCSGSPGRGVCECDLGWTGARCDVATQATSFLPSSFIKLALSFTPSPFHDFLQLRFRTRNPDGQFVGLSSSDGKDRLLLQLAEGRLCLFLQIHHRPLSNLCLSNVVANDGSWHSVAASRYGSATIIQMDGGEDDHYNSSFVLEGRQHFSLDKQEGLYVGGTPEYVGTSVFQVHSDYQESCLDDVRLSGRRLPISPEENATEWAQATAYEHLAPGCSAPSACVNVTCQSPLTCIDVWRSYYCGCEEGKVLSPSRATCEDEDECAWEPCLNGAKCINTNSGYKCLCTEGYAGINCQTESGTSNFFPLSAIVASVIWAVLLLGLICALVIHHQKRVNAVRRQFSKTGKDFEKKESTSSSASSTEPNLLETHLGNHSESHVQCTEVHNPLELHLVKPPKDFRQGFSRENGDLSDVDVLNFEKSFERSRSNSSLSRYEHSHHFHLRHLHHHNSQEMDPDNVILPKSSTCSSVLSVQK